MTKKLLAEIHTEECLPQQLSQLRQKKEGQHPINSKFQHETVSPNLPWGAWACSQLPPLPRYNLQDVSPKALSGLHLWVAGFGGRKSLVWMDSVVSFSQVYIWLGAPKNLISSLPLKNIMAEAIWVPTSLRCWSEEHPDRAFSLPSAQKPRCECKWTQDRAFGV